MTERARIDGVPIAEERFGDVARGDDARDRAHRTRGGPAVVLRDAARAGVRLLRARGRRRRGHRGRHRRQARRYERAAAAGLGHHQRLARSHRDPRRNESRDRARQSRNCETRRAAGFRCERSAARGHRRDLRRGRRAVLYRSPTASGSRTVRANRTASRSERARRAGATSSRCRSWAAFSSATRRRRSPRSSCLRRRPAPLDRSVERGFANLVIPGRMEFFPAFPSVVFDVAHNADKAQSLADALRETFPDRRFVFVVAIGESKDVAGVLRPLARIAGLVRLHVVRDAGPQPRCAR